MIKNSTTHTFWELIRSYQIIIPPLQRDYAQGRENDPTIEQIRNSLVDSLFDSVTNGKTLVLNFVYGTKSEGRFVPIDGQQRLTTLFLFHWYIFSRNSDMEKLKILENFSYQTRDTSKRFCEKICKEKVDFSGESVSEQIKECYWLTGNFMKDPTIKSMLKMLDTIHEKLKAWQDFKKLEHVLISAECPITFLWLPMDNFQKENDLYIKMNARGKLLSDFEIFKAKLQNSDLMKQILGSKDSERERIIYISKYNNQYAEFFYKLFQNEYDGAMMDFIKEMIRDSYLSYVSECNVPQKEYRADYSRIRGMNGSVFSRFIEKGGSGYSQCQNQKQAIVNGLLRVTDLLDKFSNMDKPLVFENTLLKPYYDEKTLFQNNHKVEQGLSEDVVRNALYEFLYRYGIPSDYTQKNAYCIWKRFVYNLVTNSEFKSRREDVCEAFVFIQKVVNSIEACDEASVLTAIANIKHESGTAAIRYQLKEEIVKAKLIQDASWRKEVLEAEEYFEDGQIGFILEYCKQHNGSYDINGFKEYCQILMKLFDRNKKLLPEYQPDMVERALLCMPDESENHTAHLLKQSNSTTSWGFLGKDYQYFFENTTDTNKRSILKALLDRIKNAIDYQVAISEIVDETIADKTKLEKLDDREKWRIPFIKEKLFGSLMGDYRFGNCINLSNNNKEVLLIAGTTVRAYSMELNTFLLYQELRKNNKKADLILSTTSTLMDHEGFPMRYIETSSFSIGYSYLDKDNMAPYIYKDSFGITKMTLSEIRKKLLS